VLRGVGNPKSLVNSVTRDPYNPVICVDDNRHRVAPVARDFQIHEEVLQFLPATEADRLKPVAGAARADAEARAAQIASHRGHRAVARNCTPAEEDLIRARLGGHHALQFSQVDFSWNRQRIQEKVRRPVTAATAAAFAPFAGGATGSLR
jgi:hypothetical protein